MRQHKYADIAQQVERILGKDEVPGSNPGISSLSLAEMQDFFCCFGVKCARFSDVSVLLRDLASFFARFITNRITNQVIFEFFLPLYMREERLSQTISQIVDFIDCFYLLASIFSSSSLIKQFERCKKSLQRSVFSCIPGTTGFFHRQGGRH